MRPASLAPQGDEALDHCGPHTDVSVVEQWLQVRVGFFPDVAQPPRRRNPHPGIGVAGEGDKNAECIFSGDLCDRLDRSAAQAAGASLFEHREDKGDLDLSRAAGECLDEGLLGEGMLLADQMLEENVARGDQIAPSPLAQGADGPQRLDSRRPRARGVGEESSQRYHRLGILEVAQPPCRVGPDQTIAIGESLSQRRRRVRVCDAHQGVGGSPAHLIEFTLIGEDGYEGPGRSTGFLSEMPAGEGSSAANGGIGIAEGCHQRFDRPDPRPFPRDPAEGPTRLLSNRRLGIIEASDQCFERGESADQTEGEGGACAHFGRFPSVEETTGDRLHTPLVAQSTDGENRFLAQLDARVRDHPVDQPGVVSAALFQLREQLPTKFEGLILLPRWLHLRTATLAARHHRHENQQLEDTKDPGSVAHRSSPPSSRVSPFPDSRLSISERE